MSLFYYIQNFTNSKVRSTFNSFLFISSISITVLFLIVIPTLAQVGAEQDIPSTRDEENSFQLSWNNGLQFESQNGQFKVKFGGRIQNDWAFFSQDDSLKSIFGGLNNGTEFRRVRFYNSGLLYEKVKYKLQLDFAGGEIVFKDVYIVLTKLPVIGNIKMGHFKEPFRLEVQASSNYIMFMERAPTVSFMPERSTGLTLHNHALKKRLTWAMGVFRNSDTFGNDKGKDNYNATGRLTGTPVYDEDDHRILHLGMAYSYRNPSVNSYIIQSKPEAHLAHDYVSTDTISNVNNIHLFSEEYAFVLGPLSIQGEYLLSFVNTPDKTYEFYTYYGMISYFLTGEHRNYLTSTGSFGPIKVKNNFNPQAKGWGALEIALRYSSINLNSNDINGGQLNDITVGLNWYLNPATRIMINYVLAQLNEVGNARIFQMRFQLAF